MDRDVSGESFLTVGVFECDIAHRRTVAVLCILYKIRCNPMYPLHIACSTFVVCGSAGYTQCSGRTSVNLCASSLHTLAVPQTFIEISVSLWNSLAVSVFDGVGLASINGRANVFFIGLSYSIPFCILLYFPFSSFCLYRLVLWGWDLWTDRV